MPKTLVFDSLLCYSETYLTEAQHAQNSTVKEKK